MSNKIFSELKKRHEEIKADYAIAADNSTHWTRLAGRRLGEMIALEKAMAAIAQIGALLDPQPEADAPEFASEQDEDDEDAPKGCAPPELQQILADALAAAERTSVVTDQDRVKLQIPEGFTPWSGGECPVPGQSVEYLCAADDVPVKTDRPEDWTWRHEGIPSRARIIAYRIIQPSAEAERIEDVSEPLATIEQTLITDDIPSIPREEIPIGAAVETYTDSGLETVKISGTTYVVDDEPERQAETQPEAAYAPVNEDEGLMWSNGFEADAKSKAETEQDKRPFWTRAPKPKVNA